MRPVLAIVVLLAIVLGMLSPGVLPVAAMPAMQPVPMADCPHEAMAPAVAVKHPVAPAALPLCCYAMVTPGYVAEEAVALLDIGARSLPAPASDSPPPSRIAGPETPPPRLASIPLV